VRTQLIRSRWELPDVTLHHFGTRVRRCRNPQLPVALASFRERLCYRDRRRLIPCLHPHSQRKHFRSKNESGYEPTNCSSKGAINQARTLMTGSKRRRKSEKQKKRKPSTKRPKSLSQQATLPLISRRTPCPLDSGVWPLQVLRSFAPSPLE